MNGYFRCSLLSSEIGNNGVSIRFPFWLSCCILVSVLVCRFSYLLCLLRIPKPSTLEVISVARIVVAAITGCPKIASPTTTIVIACLTIVRIISWNGNCVVIETDWFVLYYRTRQIHCCRFVQKQLMALH